MSRLVDAYDVALFDLDGVVYLGPEPVPGAAEGIADLRTSGTRLMFVTNNAGRPPQTVVEHLVDLGIAATLDDVVTSAQAGAHMLAEQLTPGSKVLVVGAQALVDEVRAVGMVPVERHTDEPVAIIQGYDQDAPWRRFDEAGYALQRGARWFATNTDSTRPTNLGLVPGAGASLAVLRTVTDQEPQVAGKPFRPLLDEAVRRTGAERPIFVGDRIDTDIEGAHNADMDSLFVFTGAHGKTDLVNTGPHERPTHIGADLRALLAPPRVIVQDAQSVQCGAATARLDAGTWHLQGVGDDQEAQLDALWALLNGLWLHGGDPGQALAALPLLP